MRKFLTALLLCAICCSAAYADELVLGSRGEDVLSAQQRLCELGYLSADADGRYGEQTARAVEHFQRINGLRVTGTVDSATHSRLFSDGALSDDILLTQNRLIALGYLTGRADGIWGKQSAQALRHFQRVNGLPETGEPDDETLRVLQSEEARRDTVLSAQNALAQLGFYTGEADGMASAGLTSALRTFQRLNGLPETGEPDDITMQAIDSAERRSALTAGSKGDAVTALQQRLQVLGLMTGRADGDYGKQTAHAVQAYQALLTAQGERDIPQNGAADPLTQAYLFSACHTPYLSDVHPGDTGSEALRIERRLAHLGYMDASADETLDDYAAAALSAFLKAEALPDAGYADRTAAERLFSDAAQPAADFVPHAIAAGDSGEAVRRVQQTMRRYGMLAAQADGFYSESLEAALQRFHAYLTGIGSPNADAFADPRSLSAETQQLLASGELLQPVSAQDRTGAMMLQRRLHTLRYLSSRLIDGDFGKKSAKALTAFQQKNGLPATGEADEATQRLLFSDAAKEHQTPYMLEIRIAEQQVYIYRLNDAEAYELLRTCICSTGLNDTPTPTGVFVDTQPLNSWHYFQKFECWAQYSWQIDGDILFHSVLFDEKDEATLRKNSVYALGHKASHGCVRLQVEDAKWIFENCKSGTIVVVK